MEWGGRGEGAGGAGSRDGGEVCNDAWERNLDREEQAGKAMGGGRGGWAAEGDSGRLVGGMVGGCLARRRDRRCSADPAR